MKSINLYVNGERFVIEDCEGAPEIRKADQSKMTAHARWVGRVGDTKEEEVHIELRVEGRD